MPQDLPGFERTEAMRIGLLIPLCLYFIFVPLLDNLNWLPISQEGAGLFDWQRLLECSAIAVALSAAVLWLCVLRGEIAVPRRGLYVSCLIFLMGAISIGLRADLHREALREWLLFFELWMLGAILCSAAAGLGNRLADVVVIVLTGGALCYLMLILVINHSINWMEIPFEQFLFIGFINVRMFSDWQGFLLPIFPLLLTQYCSSRSSRWSIYLLGTLFYTLLFISGSRSVLLGLIVAHLAFTVTLRAKYVAMFVRSLAFTISGGAFYWICKLYVLPQDIGFSIVGDAVGSGRELTLQTMTNPTGRLGLWEQAITLSGQAFPFGAGPGMFAAYPNSVAAAPHNALLSIAAEWGWVAAGISLFVVIRYFLRHMRRLKTELDTTSKTILGDKHLDVQFSVLFSLFALFVQSFVSTNVLLGPIVPICVLIGVTVIAGYRLPVRFNAGANGSRPIRIKWFFLCAVILISTTGFMLIISQDFLQVGERNMAYRKCGKPTASFAPRFWTQGWLVDLCK